MRIVLVLALSIPTVTADSPRPIAFEPQLECEVYKLAHEFAAVVQVRPCAIVPSAVRGTR
jgi:hypothetical protein